jgi:hypothetical protein
MAGVGKLKEEECPALNSITSEGALFANAGDGAKGCR